jgi:4-aminobutyrate aminotransferase/(S)-3-amino-2-methylpropionate transaminase
VVAALEALKILESPGFLDRARAIEAKVREIFEPLKAQVPALGDVRGLGAMMALEFVKDPNTKEP